MKGKWCVAAAGAMALAGCGQMESMKVGSGGPVGMDGARAVAVLQPTKGNNTTGQVVFEQQGSKVMVSAQVSGLPPNSTHGFHVHEKGDCSSGDGNSAGGHFNPTGKPHGQGGGTGEHHTGDMPNLTADAYGNANVRFTLTTMTVGGGSTDVTGKGLIVHANADDYKTQPTGNAGARLACGVIERS